MELTYQDYVPREDVETTLKVLRTVREAYFEKDLYAALAIQDIIELILETVQGDLI